MFQNKVGGKMRKILLFVFTSLFLVGCFAIVDEGSEPREVRSFIVRKEEVLDSIKKAEEKKAQEKKEFLIFEQHNPN